MFHGKLQPRRTPCALSNRHRHADRFDERFLDRDEEHHFGALQLAEDVPEIFVGLEFQSYDLGGTSETN
jgi:hypothetical protein